MRVLFGAYRRWNRGKSLSRIGLITGVLLSGSVATASETVSLIQPEIAIESATPATTEHTFKSQQWAEYASDTTAATAAENPAPLSNDFNCGPSCQCGSNTSDWCSCVIQPSDHCFDDFISPMTNPVFFEDPRNLSEARFIFLNHTVPNAAGGGDIQLYALQIRAALSDRLSLIATKDGYIVSDNPLIDDGWGDVSAGLKYLLYADPYAQTLLSAGAVYEMPVGSARSQQANGDGTFDLFFTGGAQLSANSHWISAGGFVLPTDHNDNSTWCYVSNHFDYEVHRGWYALMEYNWYHYLESGNNFNGSVEGGDLFNLGSTNVAGNDIATGAFGAKYKPNRCTEIGIAYELPLTDRRDVFENRLTFDYIRRF